MVSSADIAREVLAFRDLELKEDQAKFKIPLPLILTAGVAITALLSQVDEVRETIRGITGGKDSPEDDATAQAVPDATTNESAIKALEEDPSDDPKETSLLDDVVDWLKSIPSKVTKAATTTPTVPAAPAVSSTNRGQTIVGSPSTALGTGQTMQQAPEGTIAYHIQKAAATVGIDPKIVYAVARAESTFNTRAENKITGAYGLVQFTRKTWNYLISKYKHLGYSSEDIKDVRKHLTMACVYLNDIRVALAKTLGREPSPSEIYLGHFLGITGARRFLAALAKDPSAAASSVLPAAAKANPNIFFKNGKAATMAEVWATLQGKIAPSYAQYAMSGPPTELAQPIPGTGMPLTASPTVASSATPVPAAAVPPVPVPVFSANMQQQGSVAAQTTKSGTTLPSVAQLGSGGQSNRQTEYVRNKAGNVVAIPV